MPARTPAISVVIACVNGLPSIAECLAALERQEGEHDAEIVVVNCCRDGTAEHIREQHPHVRLIDVPARRGIPELRAQGIAKSTGDLVAVIEDHCIVRPNWFSEILRAHASGEYTAVGGPVENACDERLVDRAVFLCEYSGTMLPAPEGEVDGVPGNNVAYRREAFQAVDPATLAGCWEFFIHEEMKKGGARFRSVPAMVLDHKKEFGFLYFLSQRFHYSRSFAGMRRSRVSPPKRLLYALASPALAPLMLYRTARQVQEKGREQKTFLASLPMLTAFMISYAVGEGVGYLFGPGNSLLKVE